MTDQDLGTAAVEAAMRRPVPVLPAEDQLAIRELVARHFYALDGLTALVPGDAAENWAGTFTETGRFTLVRASGEVVVEVTGRAALAALFRQFPDVERTRHWVNDLLIEATDADAADTGCYIIALDIGSNPAPIIRTGVYRDRVVRTADGWRFASRKLILDPASPAA